jgi:eukaryotic-like serine/threonine-protein kinase
MGTRQSNSSVVDRAIGSLDEALEQVVLALESNDPLDREGLLARFPQWAEDLNQFIDNWVAMEHRTAALADYHVAELCPAQNLNGKTIGDYELLELINSGGMGVVYRARQKSLGRIVALKMVLNAVRDKTRFRIEAEAAASLHHANIVAIHEVGEFEGQPFLSMQYIAGGNLQDYLASGPMPAKSAAMLARTIATAVDYAHQRGVLHRDLKPANVLLDAECRPFVSDFGLAKQIGNSAELTRSGAIIGTPGYMAPEQAMGQVKSITVAADVYGLGAILYATLTGNAPFKTDSDLLTLRKVIEEPPATPRSIRPELDRNLETICLKCLEKSPGSRYSSARQLADDLTRYLQGDPVMARPVGFFERRWRWCARNPAMTITSFFAGLMVTAVVLISLGFAWREYVARMNAEFASIREAAMTEAVGTARVDAESKNQKAQQAVADLYTTNGLWAARTDLHGESLLWFTRAAMLEGIPESNRADSQIRCLSWLSQCPKPLAAFQMANPMQASTFQSDWPSWQLSPTESEVMFKSGNDFGIWDFDQDEIWRPAAKELQVSSAAWSKDGKWIAMGGANGELRLLDALTKATKATIALDGQVTSVSFSPSGKQLVASTRNMITILNSQNLVAEHSWTIESACLSTRFSSDEAKITVVTENGRSLVFEISRETPPKQVIDVSCFVPPKGSFVHTFEPELSADGRTLIVRTAERRVRVFDCISGKPLGPEVVTGTTYSVALSPDRMHFVVGGDSYARFQTIKWVKDKPMFVRHDCRLSHDDAITSLAFGGKKLIATAGRDRVVHLWRVGDQKLPGGRFNERDTPLATLVHTDDIEGLLFSSDHRYLVSVQRDGLVRVWGIPTFEPPGYVTKLPRGGTTIKLADNGHWLISGSTHWSSNIVNASLRRLKDGVVLGETPLKGLRERGHLLDAAITREKDKLISLHANPVRSENTMITKDDTAGSIQIWQFPTGTADGPRIPLNAEPRSVVLHPKEPVAAVLLVSKETLLIDLSEPAVSATLTSHLSGHPMDPNTGLKPGNLRNGRVQFSKDGSLLFEWGIGKGFHVWNWQSRQPKFSTEFADNFSIMQLAISPIEDCIAIAIEESNRVLLIDCADGKIIRESDFSDKIRSVEFSSSGQTLLVACDDHRAHILDLQHVSSKSTDLVHEKGVLDACFSPDGSSIATLTSDMRVHIWQVRDRQWSLRPMPVPMGTQEIAFSHDSQYILTMGMGTASIPSNEMRVLDLSVFDASRELDLQLASLTGELLSSKFIGEGGIVGMTSAEWLERWKDYKEMVAK